MTKRKVARPDEQSAVIEKPVGSGRYRDAIEVLRAAVQVGRDDIAAGRYTTYESSEALRADFERMADEVLREPED